MSGAKLDDLFDQAEGKATSVDDLFDQAEAQTAAVPDFMAPRPIPGIPGIGGEKIAPYRVQKPADIPAAPEPKDPSLAAMIFPETMKPRGQTASPVYAPDSSGRIDSYVMTGESHPFAPIGDLAGLPTRAAGAALDPILPGNQRGDNADGSRKSFGQAMASPDAGIMRPARLGIAESIKTAWDYAKDDEKPYLMRSLAALMGEAAAAGYLGVSAAEDPTILIPGVAGEKVVAMGEKLAPKVERIGNAIAEAPNRFAGHMTSELTGVSEEALRAAGTKEGRAALQAAAGKQKEIGDQLLSHIDNMDEAIPERQKVAEALANMGDLSLDGAVQALEAAKAPPVAGRLLPNEITANNKIDTYINALRGGEVPADLGAAARGARTDLSRTAAQADNLTDLSKLAGKDAADAAAAQKAARSDMGKSANRIKTMKKYETDFGWWYDQARDEAKAAAQAAREASQNVEAAGAVKGVRTQDAEAAQSALTSAERNYAVADAAAQLYGGKQLKEVAQGLIKTHSLKGEDLRVALAKAKERVARQPAPPDLNVSATDYRQLRKKLDVNIDFNTEEGKIVNNALKAGRGTMKDALIEKARASGNPDYEKWMQTWSSKLDKLDAIKKMLGGNQETRSARVEKFIGTLFGKNTEYKQQLVRDLDEIFGSQILGDAKTAALAGEFGKTGKPGLWPRQFNGRSLLGAVYLSPPVAAIFSSPLAASRMVLPMATRLEKVLKFTGGTLTGKSQAALRAMLKTRNAVVQAKLMNLIETEVPSNAVPFKRVASNEPDQTRTPDRRFAGR
jgi:hypothetical protein